MRLCFPVTLLGTGRSKKAAKRTAAAQMLQHIKSLSPSGEKPQKVEESDEDEEISLVSINMIIVCFFFPSFCFFCCPCYMQSFHSLPVLILFWKVSSQVKLTECYHLVSFPSLAISWSYIPFRFKVNINKPKGNERMPSQQNPSELTAERKFGNLHIETVY